MGRKRKKTRKPTQTQAKTQAPKKENSQVLPSKEQNLFKAVVQFYQKNQYKKALKNAEAILKSFPHHGETLAMKGLSLHALKRKDEGEELIKLGLQKNFRSHVCWHVYGLLHRSEHRYADAVKCYQRALKFSKGDLQILKDLAHLQIQRRMLDGFTETRRKILVLESASRVNWISYAIGAHLTGKYDKAVQIIESFQKTEDESNRNAYERSELLFYKNMIYRESGDAKRALAHLDEVKLYLKDPISEREARGQILLDSKDYKGAEAQYRALLAFNPENYDHHKMLRRSLQLEPEDGKYSPENIEGLKALYASLRSKYPKCTAARRLPLDFLQGDDFRAAADAYMRASLIRGIPSLFRDLRPVYSRPGNTATIEEIILGFISNLRSSRKFAASDEDLQSPAVLLWSLYYAGQHFDHLGKVTEALEVVDEAIAHTPTTIDLYVLKARIFKHAGDVFNAFAFMNKARKMDTADRYLNTKCTRYALRAGKIDEAHAIVSLFLREPAELSSLYDMQCCWYELCAGDSYVAKGDLENALTKYLSVDEHFNTISEDQFDFHGYCLRKSMTLRAYVDMLRFQDTLRAHRYYFRAGVRAIKNYLKFYDYPAKMGNVGYYDRYNLSAEELARVEEKRQRLHKKAAAKREKKEKAAKVIPKKPAMGNPLNKDPIEQCVRILRHLEAQRPDDLETQLCAYEVAKHKDKLLMMLKSIKRLIANGSNNPEVHKALVDFLHRVRTQDSKRNPIVAQVLEKECKAESLAPGQSLAQLNQAFLARNPTSLLHRLAAAQVMQRLGEAKQARVVLADVSGCVGLNWKDLKVAYEWLVESGFTEEAQALQQECKTRFPIAILDHKVADTFGYRKTDLQLLSDTGLEVFKASKVAELVQDYSAGVLTTFDDYCVV